MKYTLVVCQKCEKTNRIPFPQVADKEPICGNCKSPLPFHSGVQELSDSSLKVLLRTADRPVIIDFWAEWCGPCKAFAPTFKQAAQKEGENFIFAKLDTEHFPLAAQTYGIRGIPTLIAFKAGKEIDRQSGALPLPHFLQYLEKLRT